VCRVVWGGQALLIAQRARTDNESISKESVRAKVPPPPDGESLVWAALRDRPVPAAQVLFSREPTASADSLAVESLQPFDYRAFVILSDTRERRRHRVLQTIGSGIIEQLQQAFSRAVGFETYSSQPRPD